MKSIKSILYFLSIILFLSCSKEDGKIDFTFLQVNDVYEIAPIQGGEFGGMARVETVHQQLLKENKNTMLVMAGDFLNPSLLGTIKYNGERVRGKQMIETMNAMNFDLVAFGNHEFDLSANDLQKRMDESNFNWITGNVLENKDGKTAPFTNKHNRVNETFIKEFTDADGTTIKVGFISVCVPSNPRSFVTYKDVFEEAERSYNDLKDKVDVVFGLTHVTIAEDTKIAKLLPNIPLIMGGHEHTNMLVSVGNSFVAKADANAKTAYIHRISFDTKTKKVTVQSELKEINSSIVADKRVGEVVNKWETILNNKIKETIKNPTEVIFNAETPLDGRDKSIRSVQTNLGELITKSMSFSFDDNVDCALVNGGSIRIDDELDGNITAVDIFRVLPYGGAVLKVKIKGSLLLRVLEYGEKAAGTGAYLQRYNVEKINNKWLVKSKAINPNKTYTVAFSDYLLKGFDIPFLSEKNKEVLSIYQPIVTDISFDIRNAVILYLKSL
ncbi:Trifunctional nucleotide phosphoesterase protein YfkN [Polaribacter huanghezhanensis]|uniref:bifunctional metallophosphatase/5'-nucleotidase n=1 Tax=Polaribacter huanghezhanensis TaxID=1354726 RepID=UPI002648D4DD|nr:bifunctional metallophosphatase/5'-nucleotidase [Polaribacter huanghezhanensis]WKD86537.1 Trifunctional nucleotide phosphoesterase protein YfkN [Polaribacter huanghezhanensis]